MRGSRTVQRFVLSPHGVALLVAAEITERTMDALTLLDCRPQPRPWAFLTGSRKLKRRVISRLYERGSHTKITEDLAVHTKVEEDDLLPGSGGSPPRSTRSSTEGVEEHHVVKTLLERDPAAVGGRRGVGREDEGAHRERRAPRRGRGVADVPEDPLGLRRRAIGSRQGRSVEARKTDSRSAREWAAHAEGMSKGAARPSSPPSSTSPAAQRWTATSSPKPSDAR